MLKLTLLWRTFLTELCLVLIEYLPREPRFNIFWFTFQTCVHPITPLSQDVMHRWTVWRPHIGGLAKCNAWSNARTKLCAWLKFKTLDYSIQPASYNCSVVWKTNSFCCSFVVSSSEWNGKICQEQSLRWLSVVLAKTKIRFHKSRACFVCGL